MSMELNKESVEQAGGDERAAFEAAASKLGIYTCNFERYTEETAAHENRINARVEDPVRAGDYRSATLQDCWKVWQEARAALAQPSPALPPFAEKVLAKLRRFYDCAEDFESGGVDIGRHWLDLLTQLGLLNRVQRSPAFWEISQQGEDLLGMPQPSPAQAEAERPEVAVRVVHSNPVVLGQCGPLNANDELMTVAQHAASVARWAEMFNRVEQERDAALARVAELEQKSAGSWTVDTSCGRPILMYEGCSVIEDQTAYEVIRMIKWIGELERQKPVAWMHDQPNRVDVIHRDVKDLLQRVPGSNRGIHRPLDVSEHYTIPLYAAPVAQAQQLNDLDKQCRDDVARALGLRPNQERGFAWSYLLASIKSFVKASEDSAQAQHSVPEGYALLPVRETEAMHDAVMALLYKGVDRTDTQKLLDAYIAAAPGKEGV